MRVCEYIRLSVRAHITHGACEIGMMLPRIKLMENIKQRSIRDRKR